jgi:hypothetical protein
MAVAMLFLAAVGLYRLANARRPQDDDQTRWVQAMRIIQSNFHRGDLTSAPYADVVYPMESRSDRGSHLSHRDVQQLLPAVSGPAHQLVKNDAFNILDRAARAHSLPTQDREAVLQSAVQALQAAGPDQVLTRASSARFLGDFGDRRAVQPLLPLLRDPNNLVRMMTRISLKKLGEVKG